MRIDTLNRKAFEKTTIALEHIEKYYKSKDVSLLENAEKALTEAIDEDSSYLGAVFYLGMTKDLIGKSADSPEYFNKILEEVEDPNIRDEIKYNLAVSYYHRYGHKYLAEAEKLFNEVYMNTSDLLLKNISIANLAQTYAMWMQPSYDQKKMITESLSKNSVFDHISSKYASFQECNDKVRKSIKRKKQNWFWNRIEATIDNACGMAHMYYTDYMCKGQENCINEFLQKSQSFLLSAESIMPNDWANTCDLGSLNMRLALIQKDENQKNNYFDKGIENLNKVVNYLRPNYGFAFYELGQLYRLSGNFEESVKNLNIAINIPVKYRDVGDDNVNMQLKMALEKDTSFTYT